MAVELVGGVARVRMTTATAASPLGSYPTDQIPLDAPWLDDGLAVEVERTTIRAGRPTV